MDMIMLGTGGGFSKKYYNNNALFNLNGYRLLIDCGSTAHRSLHELGLSWEKDVDGVLVTHIHADHVGGLEEIALEGKFKYGKKIDLFAAEQLLPLLWENSLKGGVGDDDNGRLEDFFRVTPLPTDSVFRIGGMEMSFHRTQHVPGKLSYGLTIGPLFYSSDSRFDERLLLSLPSDIRYILHDCSMTSSDFHASLEELLSLPAEVRQKIWLMHYTDDLQEYEDAGRLGKLNVLRQHRLYQWPAEP